VSTYSVGSMPESITAASEGFATSALAFIEGNTAPGLAYGVVFDGKLLLAGGAGMATIGGQAPDARAIFRIASMTKSFTAAAVLRLRDAGLLRLELAVADYVPELSSVALPTSDSRPPTVRDLLTMQPGWATDDPWADRQESMQPADYSAMLSNGFAFNERPGTDFEYSNLGYTILGRVITNVSGVQYQEYVTTQILRPLGMNNTGFTLDDVDATLLADGHFKRDEQWHVEPVAPTGEFAPLGGLFSNVEDLALWVTFMCDAFAAGERNAGDEVLSRDSRREMQQGHRHIFSSVNVNLSAGPLVMGSPMYGFGLMNAPTPRFGTTVGHSGGYPGYGTHMVWHPVTGVGAIALSNGRYGGAYRVATQMLRELLIASDAPSRVISPTSATKSAFIHVNRLLVQWDDAAADALFSPNVDEDEPRAHRVQALAEQIAKLGGITGPAEQISGTAASHLVWWVPCATGRLRVEIRLAPQAQQKVQTLNLRAVPHPSAELATTARLVVEGLFDGDAWPLTVAIADELDTSTVLQMASVMRAFESTVELAPLPTSADSSTSATFRVKGGAMSYELALSIDDSSQVTKVSLTMVALTSDDNALVRM